MQEIMKDGSEGKVVIKDTIEDLVPYIKKSLSDPNVKFVRICKTVTPAAHAQIFTAEEEKKDWVGQLFPEDKKE